MAVAEPQQSWEGTRPTTSRLHPPSPTSLRLPSPLPHHSALQVPAFLRAFSVILVHNLFLLCYPKPLHSTDSYAYATTFLGAW